MDFKLAVLGGDGIGPEVTAEGVKALEAVGRAFGHNFALEYGDVGGISIDRHGVPLTDGVRDLASDADAVLFGAVGGPKWDDPSAPTRPEDGLLALRAHLGVFANIRPVKVYPELTGSSVLKPHVLEGVDMVVVRELTGGCTTPCRRAVPKLPRERWVWIPCATPSLKSNGCCALGSSWREDGAKS